MNTNFTAKAYYIFLFMLPLLFFPGIADRILLPRQLLLSVFTLLIAVIFWKTVRKASHSQTLDAVNLAMVIYLLVAAVISFANAKVLSETWYVLSKLWLVVTFSILTGLLLKNKVINSKHIIGAMVIFGCVSIATALADILERTLRGQYIIVQMVSGGFGNKNLLSSVLFLCLPFFMIGIRERRLKVISFLALFFALLILAVVRTRTTLIATGIFFGIVAFFYFKDYFKRRFWLATGAFLSVAVVVLFAFTTVAGDSKYLRRVMDTNTIKERLGFWRNSLDMFREYPFGVGLGNWQVYVPKYGLGPFDYSIANGIETVQRPHNDFLWILCETGIVGFAAFLGVFFILGYMSFELVITAEDKYQKWQSVCLFSGLAGFLVIAFFDFPMERIEHLVILVLLSAMVIHEYGTRSKKNFTIPIKDIPVMLFAIAGVCFSLKVASGRFAGERYVYKMDAARKNGNADEALFLAEKADRVLYRIDSRTIPLEWYKGVARFSKQQYAESEACFQKAYALTPYNIQVINNLASCYEINGKRQKAIAMYRTALEISPGFEEARLNLAAVYFNDKAFGKAFNTIDSCAVETHDPKYKMFLPPILKSKAEMVLKGINFPVSDEIRISFTNLQDFSAIYYESKKNNITFEQQVISHLKNNP